METPDQFSDRIKNEQAAAKAVAEAISQFVNSSAVPQTQPEKSRVIESLCWAVVIRWMEWMQKRVDALERK